MGKHTGGVSFAALKGNKGRFSTLFATQKGDCREAIAFLRRNMKQEKHEIRCSEIEKRLGKYCFFEKSYKNTRTIKKQPFSPENGCFPNFLVVTKVTGPTTWGLFGVYASGEQRFSNFLAENDFWGKTTLLGESSGKLHSKW